MILKLIPLNNQVALPQKKGFNRQYWRFVFAGILIATFAGLPSLHRYLSYDNFCLDTKLNGSADYVIRGINPDMEWGEAFIKDYLVNEFSKGTLEPDYPRIETKIDKWPFPDANNFHTSYESRTTYQIILNKDNSRLRISYHRESDKSNGALLGIRVYILQSWRSSKIQIGKDPFITVRVERVSQSMDEILPINQFTENILDSIKKCHP